MFDPEEGWIGPFVLLFLTVICIIASCYVYCACHFVLS